MTAVKPRILITIDTELSNFPDGKGLWGRVGDEDWGLTRMLDVFREAGIPATFFLDVYGKDPKHVADQRRAAETIVAHGQDLQLHTHPSPSFDRQRERLRDYSLAEQEDIIAFGCERIKEWTGKRPVLHRAGDWGADNNSIEAMKRQGIRADFSASPWSANCGYDREAVMRNGWMRINGLLCGVGTCYRDRLTGRMRRVDIEGPSFTEITQMLSLRIDPMFLTLHSFSLMQFDRSRTRFSGHPGYISALRRFFDLARDRWGYEPSNALQAVEALEKLPDAQLPSTPPPTSSAWASTLGIVKSVNGRIRTQLR